MVAVAARLRHPENDEDLRDTGFEDAMWQYRVALPGLFLLTVFGTISSLYVFCIGSQDPGSLFFWASLSGTSLMLFAQMLLLGNCQRLEITQAVGSFSIACVVSIQFITALGVQGGDFNGHPVMASGMVDVPDMPLVLGERISGVQKAVAWISPLLTLVAFAILLGGRLMSTKALVKEKGLLSKDTLKHVLADDTISQSPVTRALILFFFTLAAIGNVFVFSFIAASGNATAMSFGMFGVLLNIAVLFNAIGSKPNLNTGSGTDSERDALVAADRS